MKSVPVQWLAHGTLHLNVAFGRGAVPVMGSLVELTVQALATLMAGSDVVVFSAGAGGKGGAEMTNAIDGRGLELAVAAAQQAGVTRFLLVSAFPESFRGREVSEGFENYMAVKKLADVHLAESALDWVTLRPGTLLDRPSPIPFGTLPRHERAGRAGGWGHARRLRMNTRSCPSG